MTVMQPRVTIVGAGPAGIRAAAVLCAAGLRPTIIDEGARAGGQIYRRPPVGFERTAEALYGFGAPQARTLHALFDELVARNAVDYRPHTSALSVAGGKLHLLGPDGAAETPFDRLILATGATDRLAPIPGWQAQGVYSLGAAQIALKAQGVALGRRIVLLGSGPLLTLVAVQLLEAGAAIAAVLDTAPMRQQIRGAGGLAARPRVAMRGLAMRARLGRLYKAGVMPVRIEMGPDGPKTVVWRDARGRDHRTDCDAVAMGWHLRAETHLADLAGATFEYDALWAQWLPRVDAMGRAASGLYLAGDGVRILGADGAELSGRLAAAACLADLGLPEPGGVLRDLQRRRRMELFAAGLARAFPWPTQMVRDLPDDTVVCRCEGVTAATLRTEVDHGGAEANRAKSLSRVGMGRCQGRYCQLAGAELVAAQAGCSLDQVGRLRSQPPVRPAPIGALLKKPAEL